MRGRVATLAHHLCPAAPRSASASAAADDELRFEPIAGCSAGAVAVCGPVRGLSDAAFETLEVALLEYGVIVIPGQHDLSQEEYRDFGERFGELEFDNQPLSNRKADILQYKGFMGNFTRDFREQLEGGDDLEGVVEDPDQFHYHMLQQNESWHTDSTFKPLSSKMAMLYAKAVPPSGGGQTEFCDMRAAWDALDGETQHRIEGLTAYHSRLYSLYRRTGFFDPTWHAGWSGRRNPTWDPAAQLRPLVKVHPETGRKSIFVASHAFAIPGLAPEESEELMDELVAFAAQPPRTYSHAWEVGDLVLWDNRCFLHRARPYDRSEPRSLWGTRVAGAVESEQSLPSTDDELKLRAQLDRVRETEQWRTAASRVR